MGLSFGKLLYKIKQSIKLNYYFLNETYCTVQLTKQVKKNENMSLIS